MIYQMEKLLEEHKDKVSAEDRADVETALTALKTAVAGDDAQAITTAIQNLTQAAHKISSVLYSQEEQAQAGSASGEQPGGTDDNKDDNVVDAEVVDE